MKTIRYIFAAMLAGGMLASCGRDIENVDILKPTKFHDQYYQNLREYKASDHAICFGWFTDYAQSLSPATRFAGLPDSLDICSLWGGIPTDREGNIDTYYLPDVYHEMKWVQQVKGTKFVAPTIIRIKNFPDFYKLWEDGDPEAAMRALAHKLLRPIFEQGIDGIDMDYEPEGDPLSGDKLDYFVEYVGKYVGPSASSENTYTYDDGFTIKGDPSKLLCIDYGGNDQPSENTDQYTNWYVKQTYKARPGGVPFNGCAPEKVVYTENVGEEWQKKDCGMLIIHARYNPGGGHRKGGFGAYYIHRDYINSGYGYDNYANVRRGIQIQNPAVH